METLMNWFSSFLQWLGLWKKEGTVVFLGLDNAGKTTLLYYLKTGHIKQAPPTFQPTKEDVEVEKLKLSCFDLGGHPEVHGIVFMVDAADRERMVDAKNELNNILADENIRNVPVIVLCNKMDLMSSAMTEEELRNFLGLTRNVTTGYTPKKELEKVGVRPLELFCCSVVKKSGIEQPFRWLADYI